MERVTSMLDAENTDDGEYQLKSFSFDVDMGNSCDQANKKMKTG